MRSICFKRCMEKPVQQLAEPENSHKVKHCHTTCCLLFRSAVLRCPVEIIHLFIFRGNSCGAGFTAWLPITIYISMLTFNAFECADLPKTSYAFSTSANLKSVEIPCQQT